MESSLRQYVFCIIGTVKLGFQERLSKEQIGDSEAFAVTNLLFYLS